MQLSYGRNIYASLQNNPVDEFTETNRKFASEIVIVSNKIQKSVTSIIY